MRIKPSTIITFVVCLAIPLAVGSIAGIATADAIKSWYAGLAKPAFNPPGSLFGPVWTLLYILMGISLFLIWRAPRGMARTRALWVFAIQLALNFAWSFLFFSFHQIGWAFAEILLIWIAVLTMILLFARVNKTAALIQIPYILWVSFASVLNGTVWWIN